MAPTKPKKSPSSQSQSKTRSSSSSGKPSLQKTKGENFYRDAKKVKRLKMLTGGKAVRDRDGKIVEAAAFQKGEDETAPGRVQPDRRWFGNTRVISQTALDHFRTSLQSKQHDPYSVLLRRNKLPMQLLDDASNPNLRKRSHIVETESFSDTFGPKAQRKRPRISAGTFEELSALGSSAASTFTSSLETLSLSPSTSTDPAHPQTHADYIEPIYAKGTSRRIYGELYKVIDSSDVVLHVLDARDPMGTMCESVLEYIRREKAHKQVVLVINKCDLVPNWVTARYIQHLTPRYPTIAFHASPNHSFGKGSLIQLLRQFSQLHSDKKQISVGFIGYPNVGKSSVINTLKSGKVCRVAPVPGETKVWQYITLTRRIYLIDCPGIVPTSSKSDSLSSTVLKGVVRVEALPSPSEHIPALLQRVKPLYLARTYGLPEKADGEGWEAEELLDVMGRMKGRLLKGGEPDREGVAKVILSDWVRGRIPFFVPPPERSEDLNNKEEKERKRNGVGEKGKGKEGKEGKERGVVPGVKQNLGGIVQKMSFAKEDVRRLEDVVGPEEEEEDGREVDRDEDEGSDVPEDEVVDGEEDELAWNDVFPEAGAGEAATANDGVVATTHEDQDQDQGESGSQSGSEDADDAEDGPEDQVAAEEEEEKEKEEEEGATKKEKEARMTTNKKKATNFYSGANVKNKNRNKAKLMKALQGKKGVNEAQAGGKGRARARRG